VTACSYGREVQPGRKPVDGWKILDRLLARNGDSPARERLTLIRIFEELRALGFEGGYDVMRRYAGRGSKAHSSATASPRPALTLRREGPRNLSNWRQAREPRALRRVPDG
jgi:hypothetical protein